MPVITPFKLLSLQAGVQGRTLTTIPSQTQMRNFITMFVRCIQTGGGSSSSCLEEAESVGRMGMTVAGFDVEGSE
jgi:hypothetical protein